MVGPTDLDHTRDTWACERVEPKERGEGLRPPERTASFSLPLPYLTMTLHVNKS